MIFYAALLLALGTETPFRAAEAIDTLSLDDVVISSVKIGKNLADEPSNVSVVTSPFIPA